jgi:transcriptional repressor NrdR
MKCPYCGSNDTKVLDKRETEEDLVTRRRRECLKCQKRFTTYERVELADIMVIKKDKSRQTFNRDKLKNGIVKACEKRPVTPEQINSAVDRIEIKIRNMESTEVESTVLGDLVMRELKKLDKVAYIRFASVYREFEDIGEFAKEVKELNK